MRSGLHVMASRVRVSRAVAIVSVIVLSAWLTTPVAGQVFPGLPAGFGEALQADFASRDLKLFIEDLKLDESQQAIVDSLFDDYELAFKTGADKVRLSLAALDPAGDIEQGTRDQTLARVRAELEELVEEANETNDGETQQERSARQAEIRLRIEQLRQQMQELHPEPPRGDELHKVFKNATDALAAWRIEKVRLRDDFVASVQAILNEDQRQAWPALSRRLTREKTLSRGRLSGESVNLFHVMRELNLPPQVQLELRETLDEYDLRLDAALQARHAELDRIEQPLMQAIQQRDARAVENLTERQMRTRVAVRDINEAYAAAIAAKLPGELGPVFERTYRLRAYPRVYRHTQGQRMIDAAQELDSIDARVLDSISELERGYLIEIAAMNDKIREVIRTSEADDQVRRAVQRLEVGTGAAVDTAEREADPITKAFQERQDLDQMYADRLKTILPPELWDQLPHGGHLRTESSAGR